DGILDRNVTGVQTCALPISIEAKLEEDLPMAPAHALGKVRRIVDARGRYIEFCKSTVLGRLNLEGKKIVVDCANGAAYHIAPDEIGRACVGKESKSRVRR